MDIHGPMPQSTTLSKPQQGNHNERIQDIQIRYRSAMGITNDNSSRVSSCTQSTISILHQLTHNKGKAPMKYNMILGNDRSGYSGIITQCERNKNVCGTTYKIELMHENKVVDTAWINNWDNFETEHFNNMAAQIYEDMLSYWS